MTGHRLALEVEPGDRRLRFATVYVESSDGHQAVKLATDAGGRLRYRLPAGSYRLRVEHDGPAAFDVATGWTTVRLPLA
jgi:hypothetical protein